MEGKKISFGFTKTRRAADTRLAAPVQPRAEDERREYIECVEEKSIKVVGGDVVEEVKPLVIPLKPNTLATAERLEQIAAEVESALRDEPESQVKNGDGVPEAPKSDETLEQQAARELLQEARRERTAETATLTVPMPALPPLLGEKESTLEDYESIPVGDFGMAMLRGMGWTPGKQSQYAQPTLRPKGLGLGADKLVKAGKAEKGRGGAQAEGEEELKLQKGSLVRVLAGKHAGMYGKVVSLDEESGRALLEPAVKGPSVSVSEHTLQAVTRQHYQDNSRVINSEKYEEYKLKEKLANEKKEKSKKSREQSSGNSKESTKTNDNYNGNTEGNSLNQNKSNRRNSSSDDEDKGFKKEKAPSDRNAQRYSSSGEDERDKQKSRNFKGNSGRERKPSGSEDEKPEKSSDTKYERNVRRSRSNSVDRKGARSPRKDSRNTLHSKSRNRSLSSEDITDRRPRAHDKGQPGRKVKESSSSEEERTEQKSQNKGNSVPKTRRSSTSSEDSRTRRKHKSKNSHKSRERSSGSESVNSMSSDEPKRSKKSKKNKTRSRTPVGKRDIDKKRKGKKKRRDRDRSPNYRKHKR